MRQGIDGGHDGSAVFLEEQEVSFRLHEAKQAAKKSSAVRSPLVPRSISRAKCMLALRSPRKGRVTEDGARPIRSARADAVSPVSEK